MNSTAQPDRPKRTGATVSALLWLLVGLVQVLWLMARSVRLLKGAMRAAHEAQRLSERAAPRVRLTARDEGLYTPCEQDEQHHAATPVVFHFTGTGESVYAAFEAAYAMCERNAQLKGARHFVFQAPFRKGAYYGPAAFAEQMWERVLPIARAAEGQIVLLGLSRGGLVAIDAALRIVSELGKPASVLALSPPLAIPARIPVAVRAIAGFEPMLERLSAALSVAHPEVVRFADFWVRRVHLLVAAMIMHDFGVNDTSELALQSVELGERGSVAGCLRAAREFRLLLRATRRDSELFARQLVQECEVQCGRLRAVILWGAQDSWLDARECEAVLRAAYASAQHNHWLATALVPKQAHALGRGSHQSHQQVAGWLEQVSLSTDFQEHVAATARSTERVSA